MAITDAEKSSFHSLCKSIILHGHVHAMIMHFFLLAMTNPSSWEECGNDTL